MQIMEAMEKPRTKIATQDENNRLPNFFLDPMAISKMRNFIKPAFFHSKQKM